MDQRKNKTKLGKKESMSDEESEDERKKKKNKKNGKHEEESSDNDEENDSEEENSMKKKKKDKKTKKNKSSESESEDENCKKNSSDNDEENDSEEENSLKKKKKKKKPKKNKSSESESEDENHKKPKQSKLKSKEENSEGDNDDEKEENKPKKTKKVIKNPKKPNKNESDDQINSDFEEKDSLPSRKPINKPPSSKDSKHSSENARNPSKRKNGEKASKNVEEEKQSSSKPQKKDFSQYDIIVDIDSIVAANEGWKVEFANKKEVEECFTKDQISVGIVGRENVGKTFIINKICGSNFASGFYTKTRGLSLKYCSEDRQQLKVLLDSAGMNGAILFYNLEEFRKYYKNKETKTIPKEEFERIRETMINDRCISEYFIQNFILFSCNILIIVVEQLSQNDQKIIERIRNVYYGQKTIIILHNLFKLELKNQVLEEASYEIEGAFKSEKQIIPNSEEKVPFFIELTKNKVTKNIYHLILGKEGSESGNFFNKTTFKYISTIIETEVNISKFDLFTKLNQYWKEKHRIYTNSFVKESVIPEFELIKDPETKEFLCKLKTDKEIVIKAPEFNALGSLREIDLIYHVYESNTPKREKIYYFELPGCSKKPIMTLKKTKDGEQILTLNIEKNMKGPNGYKCLEGGEFEEGVFTKKIKINDQFGDYVNDPDFTKVRKGILHLRFTLDEENEL